jgi:hypothetical protein
VRCRIHAEAQRHLNSTSIFMGRRVPFDNIFCRADGGMCGGVRGASQPQTNVHDCNVNHPRVPGDKAKHTAFTHTKVLSALRFSHRSCRFPPVERLDDWVPDQRVRKTYISPLIALIAVESCGGTGTRRFLVLAPTLDLLSALLCKQPRRRGTPFPKTVDDHARSPASSIHSLGRRRRHKCHGQARNFNAGGKN